MTLTSNLSKAASAAIVLTGLFGASAAFAGECPAGKMGTDVTKPGPMMPANVTDTVISTIDLTAYGSAKHQLRMRRLVVQPGGIVPWHSHADRPALLFVSQGEITEYASTCATPIVHKAGDITAERNPTSHWWKNHTTKPVVIHAFDLFHVEDRHGEHMM